MHFKCKSKNMKQNIPKTFLILGAWLRFLETIMEASAPESDMKRILSKTARDRDCEW